MRVVSVVPMVATIVVGLCSTASTARAQGASPGNFYEGGRTGIGYTATPPNVLAGIGAWRFFGTGRMGAFADAKLSVPSLTRDDRYCPTGAALADCSIDWVQTNRPADQYMREKREYLLLNGGLLYALTNEFAVMLGAGAARRTILYEFYDDPETDYPRIPTRTGIYYVEDEAGQEWLVQGVAGALLRAGRRIAFRFGYETAPGSLSVGFYLVLP